MNKVKIIMEVGNLQIILLNASISPIEGKTCPNFHI